MIIYTLLSSISLLESESPRPSKIKSPSIGYIFSSAIFINSSSPIFFLQTENNLDDRISKSLSEAFIFLLPRTIKYIFPILGIDRRIFSTRTFPRNPVHPVKRIFFPLKNSLIFSFGSFSYGI